MLVLKCDRCGLLVPHQTTAIGTLPGGWIGLEILEYYTPMQIPPAEKKATLSRDLCGKCRIAFEQFLAEKPVWGKPPVEVAPIVGKEQTPDPFTPVKLPVEQRATSRVSKYAPDENSLDSQE